MTSKTFLIRGEEVQITGLEYLRQDVAFSASITHKLLNREVNTIQVSGLRITLSPLVEDDVFSTALIYRLASTPILYLAGRECDTLQRTHQICASWIAAPDSCNASMVLLYALACTPEGAFLRPYIPQDVVPPGLFFGGRTVGFTREEYSPKELEFIQRENPQLFPGNACPWCGRKTGSTPYRERFRYRSAPGCQCIENREIHAKFLSKAKNRPTFERETLPRNLLLEYSSNVLRYYQGFLSKSFERNPLFLGVELELESREGVPRDAALKYVYEHLKGFCICKADGSLKHGAGFEVVSVPATLEVHKIMWKAFFDNLPYKLMQGWRGTRCGMHIHISTEFLTESEIFKIKSFIASADNKRLVDVIAGRAANSYCTRDYRPRPTFILKTEVNHYQAASFSPKACTLELRIFRSNISPAGFRKNLEFADALVHFVKQTSCSAKDLTQDKFLAFLARPECSNKYRNLITFLYAKGGITKIKAIKYYDTKGKSKTCLQEEYNEHCLAEKVLGVKSLDICVPEITEYCGQESGVDPVGVRF